jgi:hypothetical protein
MTRNQNTLFRAGLAASLALAGVTAFAQVTPTTPQQPAAPAAPTGTLMSLTEIESQLTAQGIRVREMEVHDKVLEVEGLDAQGRKIDLIVDRRNGEILSRKFDD